MAASRVVLVTGCSTGIGRDVARRLADEGWTVVATARRAETLADLAVARRLALDVTDEQSAATAVWETVRAFGRIDALVNNAGYAARGAMEEMSAEALRAMFEVNVIGAARMLRLVAPFMREQRFGTIVNVSSIAGRMSMPVNGGYSASKFALEAISDAARQELAPFGVHVVIVEPGPIATRFDATMHTASAVLADPSSPYAGLYARDAALAVSMRDGEPGPEVVSDVVVRVLAAGRPKARWFAGVPFLVSLMMLLPAAVGDRLYAGALAKAAPAPAPTGALAREEEQA